MEGRTEGKRCGRAVEPWRKSCCTGQGSQPGRLGGEQVAGMRPEWKELPFPAWVGDPVGYVAGNVCAKAGLLEGSISRAGQGGQQGQ